MLAAWTLTSIPAAAIIPASAIPAINAGKYIKVFGFTMPLHFHDVGQIPNKAVSYPPRILLTDKEVTSIFDAE